ncbi:MAG: hypothetical protein U5L00_01115 [Desulfovermiculus sp.]|nr:hypothetical protein [Desulfovermiculus sp.]
MESQTQSLLLPGHFWSNPEISLIVMNLPWQGVKILEWTWIMHRGGCTGAARRFRLT